MDSDGLSLMRTFDSLEHSQDTVGSLKIVDTVHFVLHTRYPPVEESRIEMKAGLDQGVHIFG